MMVGTLLILTPSYSVIVLSYNMECQQYRTNSVTMRVEWSGIKLSLNFTVYYFVRISLRLLTPWIEEYSITTTVILVVYVLHYVELIRRLENSVC